MSLPSLLQASENFGKFQIYDLTTQNDGYGGYATSYTPGATFDGVLVLDNSINAQVAQKEGVTGVYTLTVDKIIRLPWHTVFKKISGENLVGTFFRVTDRDDKSTPNGSSIVMRTMNVEEYAPSGVIQTGGNNG